MTKENTPNAIQVSGSGPVRLRVVETGPKHSVLEIGVDYSKAEPPERAYYADYCQVEKGRFSYSLCFGKLISGTRRLRTMIEVAFPGEMFAKQLWGSSREFHKGLAEAMEKLGITKSPPFDAEPTDKVQTFRANNVFMGMWGEEAVLDFYYMSPRDVHYVRMKTKTGIDLEPVVRVAMATALVFEFLEKCGNQMESTELTERALERGSQP